MDAGDYAWQSATDLVRELRSGALAAKDLVDAVLVRIAERNPTLNAVVYASAEEAREAAARADEHLRTGEGGPLTGIPVLMKDLFDFKPGWPSTLGGIRALADHRVSHSCLFVERMEAAGAIVIGKTNSPILGARGVTDNPLFGPTANPFDTSRNAGGSSGGSAAAVADGLVPIAEGTDAGGSIRIPAAWTSTFGFKPSAGRVPTIARPLGFLTAAPFITEGPITRAVADAALVMSVLAGPDPRAPHSLDGSIDWHAATTADVDGLTIGFCPDLGGFPIDPDVARSTLEAVEAFEAAGVRVRRLGLDLPAGPDELAALWHRTMQQVNLAGLEELRRNGIDLIADLPAHLPEPLAVKLADARRMPARQLRHDDILRTQIFDAVAQAFAECDAIVSPTTACLPVKNGQDGNTLGPTSIEGTPVDPSIGWTLTYPFNFTGHPAASVPAGLVRGLPAGLQIVGRPHRDDVVLALSAAYERVHPWSGYYAHAEARPLS